MFKMFCSATAMVIVKKKFSYTKCEGAIHLNTSHFRFSGVMVRQLLVGALDSFVDVFLPGNLGGIGAYFRTPAPAFAVSFYEGHDCECSFAYPCLIKELGHVGASGQSPECCRSGIHVYRAAAFRL